MRELDLPLEAGALAVDVPVPERARLALAHAGVQALGDVLHRARAISLASRIRSISCAVLIARAALSTGAASTAAGKASNHALVKVVGSPTIWSAACVPSDSSSPTRS